MKHKYSRVTPSKEVALQITRTALLSKKSVYVAITNKPIKYLYKTRSRIVYIGETRVGTKRINASAAYVSQKILYSHGIKRLDFHLLRCTQKQNVRMWKELERSLLILFRERYGSVPLCNDKGKNLSPDKFSKYFKRESLQKILKKYS
jgi:hypothetical protein